MPGRSKITADEQERSALRVLARSVRRRGGPVIGR